MNPQDIRNKVGRFRILVVGRANAGKTTLLQRVCNTTENPEIFDGAGKKIDAAIVESSIYRGYHDISNEVVFKSNPDFVFHDSCGFEAGGEDEFNKMKEFVLKRASTLKLKERIHVIWYCIPMDEHHRAITKAEEKFFSECNTSGGTFSTNTSPTDNAFASVPVVTVFTKFDALWDEAYRQLRESPLRLTREECKKRAPDHAKDIFAKAKIWDRLCQARYPPKVHICLAEMEKDNADCGALLECTTDALGEEAMQMLLISTQRTNLSLCIQYAVKITLMSYVKKVCTSAEAIHAMGVRGVLNRDDVLAYLGRASTISEAIGMEMKQRLALWFPHTKKIARRELRLDQDATLSQAFDPDHVLAGIQLETLLAEEFASLTVPQLQPSHILMHTLQFGIALIIILEHSFFLLQEGKQKSENVLKLSTALYGTSQTQAAVEEAVKEVLSQDDGDNEKLCHMVINIILQHRMSKEVLLAQERK